MAKWGDVYRRSVLAGNDPGYAAYMADCHEARSRGHGMMIGEMLKSALAKKGWTQRRLADAAGMREAAVSEILNDKRRLTPATSVKLGTALGIDPEELWLEQALQQFENYSIAHPWLERHDELQSVSEESGVAEDAPTQAPPAAVV
jgi:plasmid maintenance system antidote protein VapI